MGITVVGSPLCIGKELVQLRIFEVSSEHTLPTWGINSSLLGSVGSRIWGIVWSPDWAVPFGHSIAYDILKWGWCWYYFFGRKLTELWMWIEDLDSTQYPQGDHRSETQSCIGIQPFRRLWVVWKVELSDRPWRNDLWQWLLWDCHLDLGRSVIKSIARWDHGRQGTGKGCNKPDGSCLGDLLSLQVTHLWIKSIVSVLMVSHQKLFCRNVEGSLGGQPRRYERMAPMPVFEVPTSTMNLNSGPGRWRMWADVNRDLSSVKASKTFMEDHVRCEEYIFVIEVK